MEFHFSALCHGDYVLWAELWFVVVCRCAISKKYSENYFEVGIIAVEILSPAGPTTSEFVSCILDIICGLSTVDLWGSPLKWESILENPFSSLFLFLE